MSRSLMQSQQVAVTLSLNVVTKNEDGTRLIALPLIRLTGLIFWLWTLHQSVSRLRFELPDIIGAVLELTQAIDMVATVYLNVACIIGKSLLWGLLL